MDSASDSDESLVPSGELHKALKDAQYWRRQCKLEQEHSVSLRANIRFLENKVEKQLGNCKLCDFYVVCVNEIIAD